MNQFETKTIYDVEKRGAEAPDYKPYEEVYRTMILKRLQRSYQIREQNHMEFNDKPYSEYYLTNRQQDMAYNPPKQNASDSRIVTGTTHEKVNTVQQLILDMNLAPRVKAYDKEDPEAQDMALFFTNLIKNSLKKEGFRKKSFDYVRTNIAQGNSFILEQRSSKYTTKKIPTGTTSDEFNQKFTVVTEKVDEYCESMGIPNTAVFLPNILEEDINKQQYIHIVLHLPTIEVARMFKDFPRWKNVPKTPSTQTVPANTDGLYGDYYLQQPAVDYTEVIMYQDSPSNEYQLFLNGVMMYPVTEQNGITIGYPLTQISPSGRYSIVKGNNERIPHFAYAKGIPTKNEVKEEVANEFLRIAVHKFRYSAFPSVGNNSDKILPANIWDPSVVVPNIREGDISVLNPNGGLSSSDYSFYNLIMGSIDETSVSKSLEGSNNAEITATQYVDQKKENMKKIGASVDGAIEMFRDFFWLRLYNEMTYLSKKKKLYSPSEQKEIEMYESFVGEDVIDGRSQAINFNLVDEIPEIDPYEMFKMEKKNSKSPRNIFINPVKMSEMYSKIKDRFYMEVVSEPEGKEQALLGILLNTLTAYRDLRGGTIPNANWDYIDKVIDENSGFENNKLFTKIPTNQLPQFYGATGQTEAPEVLQQGSKPKQPQNSLLANAR